MANRSLIALAQFIVDVDRADRVSDAERGMIVQSNQGDDRHHREAAEGTSVAQASALTAPATH